MELVVRIFDKISGQIQKTQLDFAIYDIQDVGVAYDYRTNIESIR